MQISAQRNNDLDTNRLQQLAIEINVLQRQTALGIVEIGKRLAEARDIHRHDKQGGFEAWVETNCSMSKETAYRFIRVSEELPGSVSSLTQLNPTKLYKLLELPADQREEFVSKPQSIPSTGETKTVADMTTRELAEAVRARKEAERRAEELAKQNEQLEQRLKEATLREPEVVEVYKVPEEVQQALNEAQSELKELRQRKSLTTDYQKEIRNLEERIADLMEAQRKLQNAHDEEARRQASSSEFVAVFRRAAKPLKEAKGDLERLAHSGYVHWSSVREIEFDLRVLYSVLDMVDDMLKTVDVSEITEGVVVP